MILWKRAAWLGFLSWLFPLAVSFILFPLKRSNAPLFGTLMGLVVLLTGGALLTRYFRGQDCGGSRGRVCGSAMVLPQSGFRLPDVCLRSHEDDTVELLFGDRPGLPGISGAGVLGGAAGAVVKHGPGAGLQRGIRRSGRRS